MSDMSEVNPYASPQSLGPQPGVVMADLAEAGIWRDGRRLVVHRRAQLPDWCVKTNRPAERWLKRRLAWHHPLLYFLLLVHLLIYIVVALIVTQRATIEIGLTARQFRRRRQLILVAWLLFLAGFGAFLLGVVLASDDSPRGGVLVAGVLVAVAGLALALGSAIWGLLAARLVVATRILGDYVWLKGVHPDFLARFPPWPH